MERFILTHKRSPGDIVCLTPLVRDLQLVYPGRFELDVDTTCKTLWENNPYLTTLWDRTRQGKQPTKKGVRFIKMEYGEGIRRQKHETVHFAAWFHRDFTKKTGIPIQPQLPYGDLYLTEFEKANRPIKERYWLMMAGGKSDFTIKIWHKDYFQEVTNFLNSKGLGVVQSGSAGKGHWHHELTGVLDIVGQDNTRDWIRMIYHADGVICGVTGAMHIAAALQKPCVVLAGGREAWWWEAYVNENQGFGTKASGQFKVPHRFLHTIGLLDCCKTHGCWKNKVIQAPGSKEKMLCKRPIITPEMPIAECMGMITPQHVTDAIMSYYADKTLPPITVNPDHAKAVQVAPAEPVPLTLNPAALSSPKYGQKQQVARQPGQQPALKNPEVFDHPDVGGKFTICALFYGPEQYLDMHRRCIEGIVSSVPRERMDLRVASNALNPQSTQMLKDLVQQGIITRYYEHTANDYKYPVMQEMFNDPNHPITTKWIVWFDDDSIVKDPAWAYRLAGEIGRHHQGGKGAHMVGAKFIWTANNEQKRILSERPWFQNRPWRNKRGHAAPNGNKIHFATGGFWALTTEAMRTCQIPDLGTGLTHNGGDWQIGEQLYQGGFNIKNFNQSKQFIATSAAPRRGVTTPFIGTKNAVSPAVPPRKMDVRQIAQAKPVEVKQVPQVVPIEV